VPPRSRCTVERDVRGRRKELRAEKVARETLAADDALGSVLDGLLEAQERNLA